MVASPQAPARWTPIRMTAAGMALKAGYPHRQGPDVNPQRSILTACVPCESDEDSTIVYTGKPAVYHVQVIDYPEGYSCDESFEMYTTETYGEWVIRLTKD